MLILSPKQVDKKISEMISSIIIYHHHGKKTESNIDYIKELLYFATTHNKEEKVDYLTLTIEEFKAVKDEYYENILKNCKISIFMDNINDISLQELKELKHKYKIHYFSIADISNLEAHSYQISLDLVYKYKKEIEKITNGIDDNFLKNQEDREKVIFGILVSRIIKRTIYDLDAQSDYEKKHKLNLFRSMYDNPSDEMVGLINGKCVCRGFAGIIRDVFGSVGIQTKVIIGISEEGGHAWNQIKLDGQWYNIDVTWDIKNIIHSGKSYWLLKDDSIFELGYIIENENYKKEISHRTYSINRTPGNVCKKTLSDEELAKYIDFSDLRKKIWLKNTLKNMSLEQIKTSAIKILLDISKKNNQNSDHKKR